jgi:hypothetical protein
MLVEDSLLNTCFSGKFLILSLCSKCQQHGFATEDFLSLNLDAFTVENVDHIKTMRKEFGISDGKEKKKGISGIFKSLSSQKFYLDPFSSLKEVTIMDYLNNLFNHSLIKKNER